MWYPWILGELKAALGPPGKGRLQNLTACMLSLDIIFQLARKARFADPDSFRNPNKTMRKVYGVQSGFGGAKFEIIVMEAHTEEQAQEVADRFEDLLQSSPDSRQRPIEANADLANTSDDLVIIGYVSAVPWEEMSSGCLHWSVCRLDLDVLPYISPCIPGRPLYPLPPRLLHYNHLRSIQTYTDLWLGDIRKPRDFLVFVRILQQLAQQVDERHEFIGNWLYCLRDRSSVRDQAAGHGRRRRRNDKDEEEADENDEARQLRVGKRRKNRAAKENTHKEKRSTRTSKSATSKAQSQRGLSTLRSGLGGALLQEKASIDRLRRTQDWLSIAAHEAGVNREHSQGPRLSGLRL